MTLLATFDGPKAVGKSTLIYEVHRALVAEGYNVEVLVEKELLPERIRTLLEPLYEKHRRNPAVETDAAIADLLLQGRRHISTTTLALNSADIVLMDRWYPSDAVFRRYIDVEKAINENIAAGVQVPDAVFAVSCDPATSWERAHARSRSLDSKVIHDLEGHTSASERFDLVARRRGWHRLYSDTLKPQQLAREVMEILSKLPLSAAGESMV